MRYRLAPVLLTVAITWAAAPAARAQQIRTDGFARQTMSHQTASFLSNDGTLLYLAAGTLFPLTKHGINDVRDQNRSLRIIDTAVTATALTEVLKSVVRSQRPDGTTHDSFPSDHATAAFAVASMEARYDRGTAPLWYAGATLISISRVRLDRHRWEDLFAGAAIGIATGEIERRQRRGLLIAPVLGSALTRREGGSPPGVAFTMAF